MEARNFSPERLRLKRADPRLGLPAESAKKGRKKCYSSLVERTRASLYPDYLSLRLKLADPRLGPAAHEKTKVEEHLSTLRFRV